MNFALSNSMLQFSWIDPSIEDAVNSFARSLRAEYITTSGYGTLEVYVSYAHGDEPIEAIYGADKLPRLIGLKTQWDPRNVFAFNNALPRTLSGNTTSSGNTTFSGNTPSSGNTTVPQDTTGSGKKRKPRHQINYKYSV